MTFFITCHQESYKDVFVSCMSFKEKHKKDRLSKIHYSMLMLQYHWNIEYTLSIHLFYGQFYLLTLSYHIVTKSRAHLHNPAVERCRFVLKGLIRFMFMATLSTLPESIEKKITDLLSVSAFVRFLVAGLYKKLN